MKKQPIEENTSMKKQPVGRTTADVVVGEMSSQTHQLLENFGNTRDAAARATYDELKSLALEWMREIPGWLARESYLDTLAAEELYLLIQWLWLYRARMDWVTMINIGTAGSNLPPVFAEIRQPAGWIKWNVGQRNRPDLHPLEAEALEDHLCPTENL